MATQKIGATTVNQAKAPEAAATAGDKMVTVTSPRAFTVAVRYGLKVQIKAGVQEIPESLVDNWYVKAHGVTAYQPASAAKKVADPDAAAEAEAEAAKKEAAEVAAQDALAKDQKK